ncbi:MAG: D-alanine--D-alanine ligase [Bacteroidetes bacterium]|nr:D-alanine--D-alanine ligase [Bacteroidota bacterium]
MSNPKINIAVFVGGTSPEREVSKSSGKAIYKALNSLGYKCTLIDPAYGTDQPKTDETFFSAIDFGEFTNENLIKTVNSELLDNINLVFLALHGKWGEDGIIQSLLELKGIKYTGSGVLSSTIAMDKDFSKTIFQKNNVNTPSWFTIDKKFKRDKVVSTIKSKFGYPVIIKPNDQGSTVGLSIVRNDEEIFKAIETAFQYSDLTVIEEYIPGREMTVAILEDKPLPVLEIIPQSGFYDYESKYTSGMSEYIVPADVTADVFDKMQQQAITAFRSLRCKVYGRVDFRLNDKNIPFCLEVNTLPGMTETSLVPKMANAVGISFEELIDRIIRNSLDVQN